MVRYCAMMAYNITVLRTRTDHAHALALRAEAAATGGGYRRAFARYIEVAKADAEDLSSVDNMHLLPLDVLLAEYMRMHGQMDGAGVDLMRRYRGWLAVHYPSDAEQPRDPGFRKWRRLMQVVADTIDVPALAVPRG